MAKNENAISVQLLPSVQLPSSFHKLTEIYVNALKKQTHVRMPHYYYF